MSESLPANGVDAAGNTLRLVVNGEKQMIKSVFGAQVFDYSKIIVVDGYSQKKPVDTVNPHTEGNMMYFPGDTYEKDFSLNSVKPENKVNFMHEITHIWHNQAGKGRWATTSDADKKFSDPYVDGYSGEFTTVKSFFESEAERAAAKLAGKIPQKPPGSIKLASIYHAQRSRLLQKDILEGWEKNAEYDYLKAGALEDNFYNYNEEQQAQIISHYYYIKYCTKSKFDPYIDNHMTWRKLQPIEFYEKIIPFLPK